MYSLVLAFVAALVLASSMPSAMAVEFEFGLVGAGGGSGGRGPARYIENWEWNFKKCASTDQNTWPRYRWAVFCELGGSDHMCSKCFQVKNAATEDNNSVTVRIMDTCDNSSDGVVLWMDKVAFDQINTGNQGDGNEGLVVRYEIVKCEDPK